MTYLSINYTLCIYLKTANSISKMYTCGICSLDFNSMKQLSIHKEFCERNPVRIRKKKIIKGTDYETDSTTVSHTESYSGMMTNKRVMNNNDTIAHSPPSTIETIERLLKERTRYKLEIKKCKDELLQTREIYEKQFISLSSTKDTQINDIQSRLLIEKDHMYNEFVSKIDEEKRKFENETLNMNRLLQNEIDNVRKKENEINRLNCVIQNSTDDLESVKDMLSIEKNENKKIIVLFNKEKVKTEENRRTIDNNLEIMEANDTRNKLLCNEKDDIINKLQNTVDELTDNITNNICNQEDVVEKLNTENDRLTRMYNTSKTEYEDNRRSREYEYDREIKEMVDNHNREMLKLKMMLDDYDAVKANTSSLKQQFADSLNNQQIDYEKNIKSRDDKIQELHNSLVDNVNQLDSEIAKINQEKKTIDGNNAYLTSELEETNSKIIGYEKRIKTLIVNHEQQIEDLLNEHTIQLKQHMIFAKNKYEDELTDMRHKLQCVDDALKNQKNDSTTELLNLRRNIINDHDKDTEQLRENIIKLRQENFYITNKNSELVISIEKYKTSEQEMLTRITDGELRYQELDVNVTKIQADFIKVLNDQKRDHEVIVDGYKTGSTDYLQHIKKLESVISQNARGIIMSRK